MIEKLNKNPLKKFSTQSFLHQMLLDIQFQLDKHLKKYKMNYACKPRRFLRIITIHRQEFKDKTKLCENLNRNY